MKTRGNIGNNIEFTKIFPPSQKAERNYTDTSGVFVEGCHDSHQNHDTFTPHRSEYHEVAERAVREVKECSAIASMESGVPEEWWSCAMEIFCYFFV